jgi:hypothetical protein
LNQLILEACCHATLNNDAILTYQTESKSKFKTRGYLLKQQKELSTTEMRNPLLTQNQSCTSLVVKSG